jgi:hypothetical protein
LTKLLSIVIHWVKNIVVFIKLLIKEFNESEQYKIIKNNMFKYRYIFYIIIIILTFTTYKYIDLNKDITVILILILLTIVNILIIDKKYVENVDIRNYNYMFFYLNCLWLLLFFFDDLSTCIVWLVT